MAIAHRMLSHLRQLLGGHCHPPSVTYGGFNLSVTSIDDGAFFDCSSLTVINLPDNNITSIGSNAFEGCTSLIYIHLPSSLNTIGYSAFYGCTSLTDITLPSSLTSIGYSAFYGCTSLTSITVDPSNLTYSSIDGVLFNKDQSILVICPQGKQGNYTVPNSVSSIGDYAFDGCTSLTDITLPNSLTSIGDWAFSGCI